MTDEHMQLRQLLNIVIVVFLGVTIAFAEMLKQAPTARAPGSLAGVVLDTNNSAVASVTVTVEGGGAKHTTTTGQDGSFSIQLPGGIYRIGAESRGFCLSRRAAFRLRPSTTTTVNLRLIVCPLVHSLVLEGGQYKGETARYQPPFKEDEFSVGSSRVPLNLLIQYGERIRRGNDIQYKGFTLSDGKCFGVMVTYDVLTIYADNVRFNAKSLRLEAEGNIVFEKGLERVKAQHADIDLKGREPQVRLTAQE